MKKPQSIKNQPISAIVPMKNSDTTIVLTLKSLCEQNYPVKEIIVIDNASNDKSVEVVQKYAVKSKIPIILLKRKKNKGVGASYNLGAKKARSELIVLMHSDSTLESKNELARLVLPLLGNINVVAAYSTIINPQSVWETYNFWQKCLFARAVDQENPGLNSKFDCLRKNVFIKIGGFDDIHYGENIGIGSEDADMHIRLKNEGMVVLSKARVIHLHYLGKNYSLLDWIKSRKLLARSYGSLIRLQGGSLGRGAFAFIIKPALAVLPFIPKLHIIGFILMSIYTFWYTKKMFLSSSTIKDIRIIVLPLINIFFVYYETFWMIESYLTAKKK